VRGIYNKHLLLTVLEAEGASMVGLLMRALLLILTWSSLAHACRGRESWLREVMKNQRNNRTFSYNEDFNPIMGAPPS
jgi:hypothetical protein